MYNETHKMSFSKGAVTMTNNSHVLNWIEEMKALVKPDKVVWVTEGEEQIKALKAEAVATGLM